MSTSSQFWWNLVAIALSPAIAVQVSEFLTRRRAARGRKVEIFRTLMVTRAERLSSEHVRALNSIDLEFTKSRGPDLAVRTAWKAYLSHLDNRDGLSIEAWGERGIELMVELLEQMGAALHYSIDRRIFVVRSTDQSSTARSRANWCDSERQLSRCLKGGHRSGSTTRNRRRPRRASHPRSVASAVLKLRGDASNRTAEQVRSTISELQRAMISKFWRDTPTRTPTRHSRMGARWATARPTEGNAE